MPGSCSKLSSGLSRTSLSSQSGPPPLISSSWLTVEGLLYNTARNVAILFPGPEFEFVPGGIVAASSRSQFVSSCQRSRACSHDRPPYRSSHPTALRPSDPVQLLS